MERPQESHFRDTDYVVPLPNDTTVTVGIDALHPALDAWVADYQFASWCFVTAWNPGGELCDRRENACANVALFMELQGDGHPTVSATAQPRSGDWPVEPGFVVVGVSRDEARVYAQRYGQLAFVYGETSGPAELVWVDA